MVNESITTIPTITVTAVTTVKECASKAVFLARTSTQAIDLDASDFISLQVTSSPSSSAEVFQRTWMVTFVSPVGDVPQIQLGSGEGLFSFGNEFTFATIQDGTSAGG